MISEVETNGIRKFEVKIGNTIYYVIVSYDDTNDFFEFYITKEHTSIISFQIGFKCLYDDIYDYIKDNVVDWICDYEDTMRRMDSEI